MTPDPADVQVLVGGDVSKGEHHATAVDAAGETLLSRTVANDQAALEALLDAAGEYGTQREDVLATLEFATAAVQQRELPLTGSR